MWPLMAKQVGERRGRKQLKDLGFSAPQLLPWGMKVMITTKGWTDFQGHWRSRKQAGKIRGPDPSMSLTSGGHLVEVEDGKLVRSDDLTEVVMPSDVGNIVELQERASGEDALQALGEPRRRLTGKTAMASLTAEDLEERLQRGYQLANEEYQKLEGMASWRSA